MTLPKFSQIEKAVMTTPLSIEVKCDTDEVQNQLDAMRSLLERLPESVRNTFLERIANLADFGIETETLPATEANTIVLRFRSVALGELCAAALRAADCDST